MRLPGTGLALLLLAAAAAAVALVLVAQEAPWEESGPAPAGSEGRTSPDALSRDAADLAGHPQAEPPTEPPSPEERAEAARRALAEARRDGVHGRVVDGRGRPVAGAAVRLMASPPLSRWRRWQRDTEALATAHTDSEGWYVVGPAPAGPLRVRAEAPGYAPAVATVQRRGYRVDLILDRGGALEVTVLDAEGEGVAGALVLFESWPVLIEASADAAGTASFPGLPTGRGTVHAHAAGHAFVRREDVGVVPDETTRLKLVLPAAITLEGRVVSAVTERPLAGARVWLTYPDSPLGEEGEETVAGPEGGFEVVIASPAGLSVTLSASAEGHEPQGTWLLVEDQGRGRMSTEVRLAARREGTIQGRVESADGGTLADVVVRAGWGRPGVDAPETRTGEDGTFAIPLSGLRRGPGQNVIVLAFSPAEGGAVEVFRLPPEGEPPPFLVIVLSGVGRVTGRVHDAAGAPVAGVYVGLGPDWRALRPPPPPGSGRTERSLLPLLQDRSLLPLEAVTDEQGRFSIDGVPPATYLIQASYGLEQVTLSEALTVQGGATVERDVALGEGATIEGWVRDPDGRPVAGASVTGRTERRGEAFPVGGWLSARSQSDGRFVLHGATADSYTLMAHAAGYRSERLANVRPRTSGVVLVLRPQGWIEGTVTYGGMPRRGTFTVTARPASSVQERAAERWFPGSDPQTFNTDDGRFEVRGLPAGAYDVFASTPEGLTTGAPVRVEVVDGAASEVALALVAGAEVSGVVTALETGDGVQGATVRVQPRDPANAGIDARQVRTDAEGRFRVGGLAAGPHLIRVRMPAGIEFFATVDLPPGQRREVRLAEPLPGALRIRVLDAAGNPLADATPQVLYEGVVAVWPDRESLARQGVDVSARNWWAALRTDAAGVNVRRELAPGRYRVVVQHAGHARTTSPWVQVDAGRTRELEMRLETASPR